MIRDFELTDDEFVTILEALQYARDDAVFTESKARCSNAIATLTMQHDEKDGHKTTEKD